MSQNTRTVRNPAGIDSAVQMVLEALTAGMVGDAPKALVVSVKLETRKLVLNALMWVVLTDFARDVPYQGGHKGKDWWKVVLLSMFRREQKREQQWALDLDGYPVEIGGTSAMPNQEISDFITYIQSEGSTRGVRWSANPRHEQ